MITLRQKIARAVAHRLAENEPTTARERRSRERRPMTLARWAALMIQRRSIGRYTSVYRWMPYRPIILVRVDED